MIEKRIRDHLLTKLAVEVYLEYPETPPSKFVLFEKTGSSKQNHLESATFAFQSYALSLYEAAELNELVKAAVESLIETQDISKAKLNTDYNFTDTTTKEYRYQAVFDIYHY